MIPFISKKKSNGAENEKTTPEPIAAPPNSDQATGRGTTPGVQMLKDVWHIGTNKKKKEMPPPGVSSDIYSVPKQRQMPPRNSGRAG